MCESIPIKSVWADMMDAVTAYVKDKRESRKGNNLIEEVEVSECEVIVQADKPEESMTEPQKGTFEDCSITVNADDGEDALCEEPASIPVYPVQPEKKRKEVSPEEEAFSGECITQRTPQAKPQKFSSTPITASNVNGLPPKKK